MRKHVDIIQAIRDRRLFAGLFKSLDTWGAWIVFLKSIFGLRMDQAQIEIYRRCTNRTDPPSGGFKDAACVVGRRGGKSRVGALIGVFIGCFYDFKPYLAPGEVGMILILARKPGSSGRGLRLRERDSRECPGSDADGYRLAKRRDRIE